MSRMRHFSQRPQKEKINLNPDIGRGLLSILLFIVSGLSALSFFSLAGVAGQFIDSLLAMAFGTVRYIFPIILFTVAVLMIKDMDYEYKPTHFIGSVLFFLSFNGLIHLQKPVSEMTSIALQGYGGGLIGLALAWPLKVYANYWGGMIVLAGLFVTSIIFLFNTSLARLVELHRNLFAMFGWAGRQTISFFAGFKKEKVEFKIKGDFETQTPEEKTVEEKEITEEEERAFHRKSLKPADENQESKPAETDTEENITLLPQPKRNYTLPNLDILHSSKGKPTSGDIKANAEKIKETFLNFGIEVEMGEVRVGPTVTQYSLKPSAGIKLTRITALSNDLALALAAHPIRIEAPIPGQSLVGIEVPNQKVALVTLRELLESPEFRNRGSNMTMAIGKDVAGKVHVSDLTKMPHLLVAGTTGSGKTVCINTIILSLLFQNTPETLRFIMIDPKRVELPRYNGIPHLLTPVIVDAAKTVNALRWTIGEMERRFDVLASSGVRDIGSYNKSAAEKMPYIVFIIDELADLMASAASEVEGGIIRIAQMARAVGIHLIVATQSPRVDIITGLMKANLPGRIAFAVQSLVDSRTILDCPGAEKLLGRGDMLFLTTDMGKPKRAQGAFITEEEMHDVINFIRGDEPPQYDDSVVSKSGSGGTINMFGGPSDDQDPMFEQAKQMILESGKASASLLQRRLKVGYARAARLLDELEEAGIVGPADGAKPREVFTEHLMSSSDEIPEEEQTMDSGGTIFEENNNTDQNKEETQL